MPPPGPPASHDQQHSPTKESEPAAIIESEFNCGRRTKEESTVGETEETQITEADVTEDEPTADQPVSEESNAEEEPVESQLKNKPKTRRY